MKIKLRLPSLSVLLLALAIAAPAAYAQDASVLTAEQAVKVSTAAGASAPVAAKVSFVVASIGGTANTHLNSQADFKNADNFSVMIKPDVMAQLKTRFNADPREYLLGKKVTLQGSVTVSSGRFANPHIDLTSADQLLDVQAP